MPGFGVRVTARSKSFFVMYGTARRLKTIGRYPEMSLREARAEAQRVMVIKPASEAQIVLFDLVKAFLQDCGTRLRPKTVASYETVLKNAPDIAIDRVSKSLATTAHEIKAYKAMFNWAMREQLVEKNPFIHLTARYGKRDRFLSDDEIHAVWKYESEPYSTIVKLLLLTGQRRSQVWRLQPDWIEDDLIHFPASIMKNGEPHTIPFGRFTLPLLDAVPFTFNGWSKSHARMVKVTGVEDWTLHDLRRTWATKMAEIGTPIHVAEAHLDHRSGTISGVAAIYFRHNWLAEMREAVQAYEDQIKLIVEGNS
ncbi:MAG: integrase family protein [Pseudomonadota bacterium]